MTLLNGILAWGAATATVPLLIHLLNRSRFRTVPWGAMHLLESVVRTNNRRIRLEQLLLLLIRCAIPILLALCLARPVLTGWRSLPGDAPTSNAILLDNSYSMDAPGNGGTRFEEAVEQACAIVGQLDRRSEVAAVTTGGLPRPVLDTPTFDPQKVTNRLQQVASGFGASATVASLETGIGILARAKNTRRHLILIGDFQAADWESLSPRRLSALRDQIESLPIRPAITLLEIGDQIGDNVAVESLEFSTGALGTGQPLQLRANLRNRGPESYPAARILLRVDGQPHSVSETDLAPQTSAQVLFTCRFDSPGSHVVEVEADVDDLLDTDNRCAAAISVLDRIPVLLVDGAPSSQPLGSETDFLAVALTPFTLGRARLSDLVETHTIQPHELGASAVSQARVVVLANVARLSDGQVATLSDYVRGGGSLLVFLGNKVDFDWYNRTLHDGPTRLLPLPLRELVDRSRDGRTGARIAAQHFNHPALEAFNDRSQGNLADAEIWSWYRLGAAADSAPATVPVPVADDTPIILARLDGGDPLIVERRVGAGHVLQVATACDADWSDLPLQPAFLPLMQQLVTTLAVQAMPSRNVETGTPITAVLPGDAAGTPLVLAAPDGMRHTVRPTARGTASVVRFDRTNQPGVYTLTGPDAKPIHFVVQAPRDESDLRLLDDEKLSSLAEELGADRVESAEEFLALERDRQHGREVWRLLLAGVLVLMFVEPFFQQRFARARP